MPTPAAPSTLAAQLQLYRRKWPTEAETAAAFLALLDEARDSFARERLEGHFTGSAWLVDGGGDRVLLTHHRKLGRWLQLGGHADGDPDLAAVALKEAGEESGIVGLALGADGIFDLDRHWIPARGEVPGHWHYDARYVVRTTHSEAFVVGEESLDLAWRVIADLEADPSSDESLRRMAHKWLAHAAMPPQ